MTQHNLHFALLSAVKTGADLSKLKSSDDSSKTMLDDLKESTQEAIDGTGSKGIKQEKFCDNLDKIFGKDAVNKQLKDVKKQVDDLKPTNDDERKELEEQMVGDGKLYSKDEWNKMSDDEKEQAYSAQKHENKMLADMPEEQRKQFEQMPPKERRKALEKLAGGHPLGTPQAVQNMNKFNQMTPEMQKEAMDKWKDAMQAREDAMQGQHDMQKNLIDSRFKSLKDNVESMTKGVADAAGAVQGLAGAIGQMRERLAQQMQQSADASNRRQQQMMDEHAREGRRGPASLVITKYLFAHALDSERYNLLHHYHLTDIYVISDRHA